jgi:phosphohistidine phosphatase SixA
VVVTARAVATKGRQQPELLAANLPIWSWLVGRWGRILLSNAARATRTICLPQADRCIVSEIKYYEFPALGKKTSSGIREGKSVRRAGPEMPDVSAGREV